jgi:hypothetical protein
MKLLQRTRGASARLRGHFRWDDPRGTALEHTVVVRGGRPPPRTALLAIVLLWVAYTALNTWYPGPLAVCILGALPGLLGIVVVRTGDVRWSVCFLRGARLSRGGGAALALLLPFIPLALLSRGGEPVSVARLLVYAPLSALEQELYFRGVLLPLLLRAMPSVPRRAVGLQAILFAGWHLRALRVTTVPVAVVVLLGVAVAGFVWGWQVRRDGTIWYAAAEHALLLLFP